MRDLWREWVTVGMVDEPMNVCRELRYPLEYRTQTHVFSLPLRLLLVLDDGTVCDLPHSLHGRLVNLDLVRKLPRRERDT